MRDFKVRFELEESMMMDKQIVRMVFTVTVGFAIGDNLSLVYGASGVCGMWLKEEARPVKVVQEGNMECVSGVCEG